MTYHYDTATDNSCDTTLVIPDPDAVWPTWEEFKAEWVAALRSGEYKQATGALVRTLATEDSSAPWKVHGYCCLGVAAEICALKGLIGKTICREDGSIYYISDPARFSRFREESVLPMAIVDQYKDHLAVNYATGSQQDPAVNNERLSWHNDTGGRDFNQIADMIEQSL